MNRSAVYFLMSLFICCAITLHGQIKFANVIGEQKYEYGISGNSVFKLDSSGNSVWVKDFSGYLIPSTFPNQLIGSAFDGYALYVLELQGWDLNHLSPHTYNGALIKMDTAGNVQFIISSSVFPGGTYRVVDVYPSLSNGVWLFDDYSPGHTHLADALYIDSNGTAGVYVNFWYWSVAHFKGMHILPDLNYIVCVNEEGSSSPSAFPALTKFDENGSVIWRKNYSTNLSTSIHVLTEEAMTIDSSGNIYLLCDEYLNGSNVIVGIKINSNGTTLLGKYWPSLASGNIEAFRYQNGQLICTLNGTQIYFDTLFNNPCLNAQNVTIIENNYYQNNGGPQNYLPVSFTPVNGTPLHYTPQVFPDYCNVLSANDFIINNPSLDIFPNPAMGRVKIITNTSANNKITITDLFGRVYLQKEMKQNELELDVSSLDPGIYLVSLTNESLIISEKLIIAYQ